MALQEFNLGSQPFGIGNNATWEGAILIDSALVSGGVVSYLRYFDPQRFTSAELRTAASITEQPTLNGPDFTDEAEAGLWTIAEAGGSSIMFGGPTNPDNITTDDSERYVWRPEGDSLNAWLQTLGSGVVTLTIDDGQASLTNPTVAIDTAAQLVAGGTSVALDATVTDPDNTLDQLTIAWTATPDVGTFGDASAVDTTWTAPARMDADQVVTLRLTATDPDSNTAFAEVVMTVPSLSVADIAIPAGRELVGMASSIIVGASGDVYNTTDATVAEGPDPPTLIAANLNVTRIYLTGRTQLRISEDGLGNPETTFATGGAQENFQVHVQTSPTAVVSLGRDDIDATRSTETRLLLGADLDPDGVFSDVDALADGDRVLWFITDEVAVTTRDAGLTARAGNPTATIGAERVAITNRDAGMSARAGNPTAAIGAETVGITTRDAGMSARAGNPTAAIGAETVGITTRDAGMSARAGNPTAAIGAETVGITTRDAEMSARAGNPTASVGADLQPVDIASLLPPGKTPLEIALEGATAPRVSPDAIRDLWNPHRCPANLLPWLAWAVSVDYWDTDWPEQQKRDVVAASIEVHRHKGTVSAMRRVVQALGFDFSIVEWWETTPTGTPGTAQVFLGRPGAPMFTTAEVQRLTALLNEAKRATLHITLSQAFAEIVTLYAYARGDTWERVSRTSQE